MLRVKTFEGKSLEDLEDEVNDFCILHTGRIENIKFHAISESSNSTKYVFVIIYKEGGRIYG